MPKPWHKSWSCSLDNPKIQMLTGDQFKFWTNLLWVAGRADDDGILPEVKLVAFQIRITPESALLMIEEQVSLGLVEKDGTSYVIHDWKHWQGDGMSDAQRKRNQRARDKKRDKSRDNHVTLNGPVTSESRDTRARSSSSSLSSSSLEEGTGEKPSPDATNDPAAVRGVADSSESRWPCQDAPSFVGDLCRTFDWRLVAHVLDGAYDKDPRKLPRAWVRSGCQNEFNRGWTPPEPGMNGTHQPTKAEVEDEVAKFERLAREAGWKG